MTVKIDYCTIEEGCELWDKPEFGALFYGFVEFDGDRNSYPFKLYIKLGESVCRGAARASRFSPRRAIFTAKIDFDAFEDYVIDPDSFKFDVEEAEAALSQWLEQDDAVCDSYLTTRAGLFVSEEGGYYRVTKPTPAQIGCADAAVIFPDRSALVMDYALQERPEGGYTVDRTRAKVTYLAEYSDDIGERTEDYAPEDMAALKARGLTPIGAFAESMGVTPDELIEINLAAKQFEN